MIDWLTEQSFSVHLAKSLVVLERNGKIHRYITIRQAYLAQGGSPTNIYATRGKAKV